MQSCIDYVEETGDEIECNFICEKKCVNPDFDFDTFIMRRRL